MNPTTTTSARSARRRWLPRFGLRTLFVIVGVLGIALAYVAHLRQRVQHQRRIVAQIEAAGGEVRYNWQFGMGPELDYVLDPSKSPKWISESSDSDSRTRRSRTDSTGRVVERQYESPPGPKIVRMVLGDDVFAHVESVSFFTFEFQPAKELDPQLLLELPELKAVCLTYGQVNDEWLRCVSRAPKLRFLTLLGYSDGTTTSSGLAQLQSATSLESLSLHGEWVQNDAIAGVAGLRLLKSFSLIETPQVTSAVFSHLGGLTDLRELFIKSGKKMEDQGTEHLHQLLNLRRLFLVDTSMSDNTLAHLSELTQLELLDLSATNVGDRGMEYLADLPKLRYLKLVGASVSDSGLESLSRLPSLRRLILLETPVTDAGMPTLARMTQLEELSIEFSSVTDCGVFQLGTLKNLKELSVRPSVTNQGGEELRKTLPHCDVFW